MKFFLAFTALIALSAARVLNKPLSSDNAQLESIIAAIQSPSTDPATAALLEQQLLDILAANSPISVGPAPVVPVPVIPAPGNAQLESIIAAIQSPSTDPATAALLEQQLLDILAANSPISVGPAPVVPVPVIPAPVSPVIVVDEAENIESPVAPVPVVPAPVVQPAPVAASSSPLVQITLNINQAAAASPVAPAPVAEPTPVEDAAVVVDEAPESVNIVDQVIDPVVVVDEVPEPVLVVEPLEPIIVEQPELIPSPAITLPEQLN